MPWTIADMLGQAPLLHRLRNEFAAGRMAHAYMLEGPAGTGKCTLAHGLAARLFCQEPGEDGAACGVCRQCHMLRHDNHPDYLELPREPAELRIGRFVQRDSYSSTETIDHTPLLPFLRLKPVEGDWRVAVIPDAERMRQESANAFLKTLEEPPGNTLIILTVNARDRLPATISSRCRRVGVLPLPAETIAAELEKRGVAAGADAMELAVTAEGSLGMALALSGEGVLDFWRWLDTEAFAKPGAFEAERLAEGWKNFSLAGGGDNAGRRKNALAALDLSALALRRMLRRGGDANTISRALGVLWTAADQIVKNVKPDLVLLATAFEVMALLKG